jgi:cell wall-associated NlpC family hydrolase
VITRNVAGNYINSYDTSLDMNPRNGINLTGKNINLKAGYRFNAGDGLGGTVATTMGNLNLGGREISIDAYNNTEFKFTVLYQALEYLVNATSGGVALGKEDIKIADYVKFSQDNLEALIKLVRKANQLWAKRKEIVKQKEEEAARLAAKAAAEAEAEKQRQKEEEEKERLEAEKQRREEANLEGNGDNGADTAATGATPESAAQAVVRDPLDTFCDVVRKLVGGKYKFGGQDPENGGLDCSGLIIHALRKMGYDLPDAAVKEMVGGKLDWLTTIPPGNDDSQANQGMLNFYSFEPGRIGHVNVGVGQKQDELTGQIVDATAEGESAMTGRNGGARQLDTAAAGRINQTYPPYSTNSTPVLQGIINFDILEEKYRKEPKE